MTRTVALVWVLAAAISATRCATHEERHAPPASELSTASRGGEATATNAELSVEAQDARARLLARCDEREEALAVRAGRPVERTHHFRRSSERRMNGIASGGSPDVQRDDQPPPYNPPANDPGNNPTRLRVDLEQLRLAMDAVAAARTDTDLASAMATLRTRCDAPE